MNSNAQIVALYDHPTEPMSVEEICNATELDEVTVKTALLQGSAKYNNALRTSNEEFSDQDKEMAKMVMKQLMLTSESPQVKARMAKYIYEEKKGRNDIKGLRNVNINVSLFNQTIQQVEKAVKHAAHKTIDIDPRHVHLKEIAA